MAAAAPIATEEFDRLMAPLGPFERPPELAVAVSGGPDSMALCALADGWARDRGGRVAALVVDHRLRPESGDEALRVAGWLDALGVAHAPLAWTGPKPTSDVQAAARAARYRLMGDWCRGAGVIHLLLAHHRDDQAETLLLRLGRGSGLDGLASMASVVELPALRLLRPLLGMPPARLRATLEARGTPWLEDPSNRDPAFARTRIRALMPALAAEGLGAERLAGAARALGRARAIIESAVAGCLADAVEIAPAGYCRLDAALYASAPGEIARRALARVLMCVGGGVYAPRGDRLARLHDAFAQGRLGAGRTLGGCRLVPRRDGVLAVRETAAAKDEARLAGGGSVFWDGRFVVRAAAGSAGRRYSVRRLGGDGWSGLAAADRSLRDTAIPGAARPSLPAVFDLDGIVAVPHLGYVRGGAFSGASPAFTAAFRPAQPLGRAGFAIVDGGG